MAKIKRKVERKIDRRHKGFEEAKVIAENRIPGSSKGLTHPGSRNPRKQG